MCSRSLAKAVLTALNAHTTDQGTHPRPDSTSCRRVACPSGLLSLINYSGVNSGSVPSTRVSIPYQLAGTSQGHGWEEKSPLPRTSDRHRWTGMKNMTEEETVGSRGADALL